MLERCLNKSQHSVNSRWELIDPHCSIHCLLKVILLRVNFRLHELKLSHSEHECWYEQGLVGRVFVCFLFHPVCQLFPDKLDAIFENKFYKVLDSLVSQRCQEVL